MEPSQPRSARTARGRGRGAGSRSCGSAAPAACAGVPKKPLLACQASASSLRAQLRLLPILLILFVPLSYSKALSACFSQPARPLGQRTSLPQAPRSLPVVQGFSSDGSQRAPQHRVPAARSSGSGDRARVPRNELIPLGSRGRMTNCSD